MLDIRELMNLKEAYAEVYTPQELTEEQVWEEVENWVNSLLEEGYDLSEYTWEEMYESYLSEMGQARTTGQNSSVFTLPKTPSAGSAGGSGSGGRRGSGSSPGSVRPAAAAPAKPTPTATRPAAGAPAASARPSAGAPAAPRPAATTPAARPAAATAPTAKPSAMDQFAKANPKLAAASAERDRTRGTSATTNPLMKDMKSRLPAPKTPSPTTAKTGFDLAKKGVNLAASFDMFDVVKGYLIGEGYADTEEAALAIMVNMSEEWKQSIIVEAQVANRNPDEYERKAKQGQSREQQLKGRVMGRMSQMDPDKKAAMLKQMRAVGLDV
jgi:hypothetical protein